MIFVGAPPAVSDASMSYVEGPKSGGKLIPNTLYFESAVNPSGDDVAVLTTAVAVPGVTAGAISRLVRPEDESSFDAACSQLPSADRSIGKATPVGTRVIVIPVAAV